MQPGDARLFAFKARYWVLECVTGRDLLVPYRSYFPITSLFPREKTHLEVTFSHYQHHYSLPSDRLSSLHSSEATCRPCLILRYRQLVVARRHDSGDPGSAVTSRWYGVSSARYSRTEGATGTTPVPVTALSPVRSLSAVRSLSPFRSLSSDGPPSGRPSGRPPVGSEVTGWSAASRTQLAVSMGPDSGCTKWEGSSWSDSSAETRSWAGPRWGRAGLAVRCPSGSCWSWRKARW